RPELEFGNQEAKRDDLVCKQRAASPNSVIPSRAVGEGPHNVRSREGTLCDPWLRSGRQRWENVCGIAPLFPDPRFHTISGVCEREKKKHCIGVLHLRREARTISTRGIGGLSRTDVSHPTTRSAHPFSHNSTHRCARRSAADYSIPEWRIGNLDRAFPARTTTQSCRCLHYAFLRQRRSRGTMGCARSRRLRRTRHRSLG